MPMRRRKKHVTGCVRFPVDDPAWRFSAEGGMFVRAMVPIDDDAPDKLWMECCGGQVTVLMDETPVFDEALEKDLWPRMFDAKGKRREDHTPSDYLSVPCLAVVTLGSTGWAGVNDDGYWQCTEDDLTAEGRALIETLRGMYPGHRVVLTTWLDT